MITTNTGILDNFLKRNSLSLSDVKVNYAFASGSGNFVFNELYDWGQHFGPSGYALKSVYPGLSIGQTDTPVTNLGSGFFNGEEIVRVGHEVPYNQWCFFLNFGNEDCLIDKFPSNTNKILFSSMSSSDSTSGFNLGINDYNKLYIEYNYDENKYVRTLEHELARFNLISLSFIFIFL